MNRLAPLLLALTLTAACAAPEEVAKSPPSALYVDVTTGHGPAPCSGATPDHGYLDVWHADGSCGRVRGDFIADSGGTHAGYVFSPGTDASWFFASAHYTQGYVCAHPAAGPAYAPCLGQSPAPVQLTAGGWTFVPFAPAAVVLGYDPSCPATPGMTRVHQCAGVYTPIDGSGYATAVIDDGNPAHALNLPNPPINAGDCLVDLLTYGIQAQFTPPPGYQYYTRVAAVYTCP